MMLSDRKSAEQIITFARHEYERVGVFKIKMRSLAQKLSSRKVSIFKLIASH